VGISYGYRYLQEQVNQRVNYYYDVNPFDTTGFSQNTWGRLAASAWHNEMASVNWTNGVASGSEAFNYQYSYNTAGRVLKQRMQMWVASGTNVDSNGNDVPINLDATYAWDNEGRMTSLGYPADQNGGAGSTDTYTYDVMGRLSGPGTSWNPDGTLATWNGQTRSYNSLGQLTRIFVQQPAGWQGNTLLYTTTMDMQYIYPAGQNNGRISQTIDGVAGETVNYTYDTLNRLATAAATNGAWGNAYSYDGWGNLTGKTVTQGTAPVYSANVDPSRNGGPDPTVVDPNLDVEGRQITVTPAYYIPSWTYDPAGKMVFYMSGQWRTSSDPYGDTTTSEAGEFRFYGIGGRRLARYTCS